MPRIPEAKPRGFDPVRRLTQRVARRMYGRPMEPAGVLAHHRPLLLGQMVLGLAYDRFSRSVEPHLKHLAMLRAAQLMGCEWCLDFGSWKAQEAGCSPEQLRELSLWRDSPCFDPVERLVLEYAEAITRTPVEVSDELFARLHEHFDEPQLVELTMSVAMENLYSRFNWALGIESQEFTEGMYCAIPDRETVGEAFARR